jgi:hypothetical protein
MIILTMNLGISWILIEQRQNWATLENKCWTIISNPIFTQGTSDGATREEFS